jgi:hypothetical protein
MKRTRKQIQDQEAYLGNRTESNSGTHSLKELEDQYDGRSSSIEINSPLEIPPSKSRKKRKSSNNDENRESHLSITSIEQSDSTHLSKKETHLEDPLSSPMKEISTQRQSPRRERKRHKKKAIERSGTTFDMEGQTKVVVNDSPETSHSVNQPVATIVDRSKGNSIVTTTFVNAGTSLASLFSRQEAEKFTFLEPPITLSDNRDGNSSHNENNNNSGEKVLVVMESSSSHSNDDVKRVTGNENANQRFPITQSPYHRSPKVESGKPLMDMELPRDGGLFFFHMNPEESRLSSLCWSTLKRADLFVRNESLEEIENHWNSVKHDLTKEYKRKHKSALRKQSKRRGSPRA